MQSDYEKCLNKLKTSIDWDLHCISCYNMSQDDTMNKASNRFDKSHVLSFHINHLSDGRIVYVDQEGWDFETPEKVEDKTQANLLKTSRGKDKKIINVMLKNTMGNNNVTPKIFREGLKFSLLLLRQTGGTLGEQVVAALDPLKLEDSDIKISKDQVCLKFYKHKLDWIYNPQEKEKLQLQKLYKEYQTNPMEKYSDYKETMIKIYIEEEQNKIKKARLRLKME